MTDKIFSRSVIRHGGGAFNIKPENYEISFGSRDPSDLIYFRPSGINLNFRFGFEKTSVHSSIFSFI